MLERLKQHFPYAETLHEDARDLSLPDACVDVVFLNAVYPNIVDKGGTLSTMNRVMKPGGRMIISHPMGKSFINLIRQGSPFQLDDFPDREEAERTMDAYGFDVRAFVDEPELYILTAVKK
jgi:ubiquinone/menaquinone biosynthesis C-methylase UbiE